MNVKDGEEGGLKVQKKRNKKKNVFMCWPSKKRQNDSQSRGVQVGHQLACSFFALSSRQRTSHFVLFLFLSRPSSRTNTQQLQRKQVAHSLRNTHPSVNRKEKNIIFATFIPRNTSAISSDPGGHHDLFHLHHQQGWRSRLQQGLLRGPL